MNLASGEDITPYPPAHPPITCDHKINNKKSVKKISFPSFSFYSRQQHIFQHEMFSTTCSQIPLLLFQLNSIILSPWLGDIVDSGIGLSYRPAMLHRLEGWYDNPLPESTISPSQGLRIMLLSWKRSNGNCFFGRGKLLVCQTERKNSQIIKVLVCL